MSARRLVAVHQPNFFPWLGFFDKVATADVFVLLDNVQFPRTSTGTWVNRVKLLVGGREHWATAPVVRAGTGLQKIADVALDPSTRWRDRLLKTIRTNYARAPRFADVFPLVETLVAHETPWLAELNIAAIAALSERLGLDRSKLVRASTLAADGHATDLLIALTRAAGGTAYLCGGGAGGYQQDELFEAAGLELVYQQFVHPSYPQIGADGFVSGLSILDALMNCGFEHTAALLPRRAATVPTV
jgi:hypothetical protein